MKHTLLFAVLVAAILLLYVFVPYGPDEAGSPNRLPQEMLAPAAAIGNDSILPLPPAASLPPEKVALGEKLFNDPRLSRDDSVACASCHALNKGGTDRSRFSVGIDGKVGDVNAPTVFNSGLSIAQFWDGRAASLEEQAGGPVHNPAEMGSNWDEVIAKLRADSEFRAGFERAYPDGINPANITDAIATFERSLLTPNARFDRYLLGDKTAISDRELEGYRRFVSHGCVSCHQGVAVGGNMFQRFGVMGDYFKERPTSNADMGRFNVTGLEEDRHVFKVPGLRNVAVTSPYFHDGSAQTLSDAVRVMGKYQLGKALSEEDVSLIVAFLRTLTGEWEGQVLE